MVSNIVKTMGTDSKWDEMRRVCNNFILNSFETDFFFETSKSLKVSICSTFRKTPS